MRWIGLGLAMGVLGACSDEAADAEKRLVIVERVGSLGEVCEAAKEVARAYLEQGDEQAYREADLSSDISCMLAKAKGWNAPAQDELRERVEAEVQAQVDAIDAAALQAVEEAGE